MDDLMRDVAKKVIAESINELQNNVLHRNTTFYKKNFEDNYFCEFREQLLQSLQETENQDHECDYLNKKALSKNPPNKTFEESEIRENKNNLENANISAFLSSNDKEKRPCETIESQEQEIPQLQNTSEVDNESNMHNFRNLKELKALYSEDLFYNSSAFDINVRARDNENMDNESCINDDASDSLTFEYNNGRCKINSRKFKTKSQRFKNKSKQTETYMCSKCGVSYNVTHELTSLGIKCLTCDYWTPENPKFMENEKQDKQSISFCEVS